MDILSTLVADAKSAIGKIEAHVSQGGPLVGDAAQAFTRLQALHTQLGTVAPDDIKSIGAIFVEVGTIVQTFFPNFAQEGAFLIAIGNALEQGGTSGTVGPIRIGNSGYTVTWAPWK